MSITNIRLLIDIFLSCGQRAPRHVLGSFVTCLDSAIPYRPIHDTLSDIHGDWIINDIYLSNDK